MHELQKALWALALAGLIDGIGRVGMQVVNGDESAQLKGASELHKLSQLVEKAANSVETMIAKAHEKAALTAQPGTSALPN